MVVVEAWVLAVIVGVVLSLLFMLWTVQRGRKVRLTLGKVEDLRQSLPSIAGATHGPILDGNRVEVLQNGSGFFPPLLADIARAEESIHIESYVWWKGDICRQVAAALAERARQGVTVRLLLDASGSSRMDKDLHALMGAAGVRVAKYRPLRFSNLGRLNSRDHRKIAVFDGRVGYVFGHGFAQEWVGDAEDAEHWRDTAARVQGPIVGVLQSAFSENWVEETGEVLFGEKLFPRLEPAGATPAHVAYSFQHGSVSSVDLLYRLAFNAAQKELWIQNPYLAPDTSVMALIAYAAARGVDVRIMLPGRVTDAQFVRHAGHHLYAPLLQHKVRIWEYRKTLNHQKVMVIDGLWSHIGSTNLDNRSFESNDEISLGIVDAEIAAELRRAFLADLADAVEIDYESWRRRPWRHRLGDWTAYRFNELL
jgi:cardiolipin synthase